MKFLSALRSKSKSKSTSHLQRPEEAWNVPWYQRPPRTDLTTRLPPPILELIFNLVCPHTQDDSYESCEQSATEDACMLCDLRDLAHCAQVSRRWRRLGTNVMYHSIRIDAVHYCEREQFLSERRKRGAFHDRNADPEDTAQQRLKLLCRAIREDSGGTLGLLVKYLKLPYMTREACKVDLARTVSVMPNLRYVDLPEGFFIDDASCGQLRNEMQRRCLQIRKMAYKHGAESSFEDLGSGKIWQNLEVLDLCNVYMDPTVIRYVLGHLRSLQALKLKDMQHDGTLLMSSPDLMPFPPLVELLFENVPNISMEALADYLSREKVQARLQTLSFNGSGVRPECLKEILSLAPYLTKLSMIEVVHHPFQISPTIPPLTSHSLKTLHYEITSEFFGSTYHDPTRSYYAYLTTSLLSHGLPSLTSLYVRDPSFADSLITYVPPRPAFAATSARPLSSNNPYALPPSTSLPIINNPTRQGLQRQLEVYSKSTAEDAWDFSRIEASSSPDHASSNPIRPVSSYGLATGEATTANWAATFAAGGEVRRSVVVENGWGGFLPVPSDMSLGRPNTSGSLRPGTGRREFRVESWR